MKKWMYVIFPGIMLALFLVVYTSHVKEAEQREQARLQKVAEERKADEAKKKQAEALAAADAKKRQEEQKVEEAKREAEQEAKIAKRDKDLADAIAKYRGRADGFAKQADALEIELDRLHKEKEQLSRNDFEMAKQVELARVAKQNAEMQEQHITEMIAQRAATSSMAVMPPPPPPARK